MIGKLQFFLWSLDAGSKIELILIDFRVKMPNFMARKKYIFPPWQLFRSDFF